MKIYLRKGKRNYKEQKMISELNEVISKKIAEDPNFQSRIVPATNENELQAMYNKYIVEDVDYTEIKTTETNTRQPEMAKKKSEDIEDVEFEENLTDSKGLSPFEDDDDDNKFVDPFNRENPIVRDYVMGKDALGRERVNSDGAKTTFEEPTSFKEAFEIPTYDEDGMEEKKEVTKKSQPKSEKREKSEPFNPSFDEMSNAKKKRNTKKFAKYIVEAVCMLLEKGIVWYVTKDITEAKLAEYELNGEMDLTLLISLENGQEVTIKQFFQNLSLAAKESSTFTDTEKADITDSLFEVMMEKGIAPTANQELMLVFGTALVGKVLSGLGIKSQINDVLGQLRAMNDPNAPRQVYNEPAAPAPAPEPQQVENVTEDQVDFENIDSAINDYAETELEQVVETVE
jgi:hypothetical protein